jgi:hypothetical protein
MDWTLKATDLAIVFATLVGPILAVQAQGAIDARREQHRRRLGLFHVLMRTRATPLSIEHVNALNAVPLEFSGKSQAMASIKTAWKIYLNHFEKDVTTSAWAAKRLELLIVLLQQMGESLKYNFDAVELEKEIYSPRAHGWAQSEQDTIRQGFAAIFRGEKTLPLSVEKMPGQPEHAERFQRVLTKAEALLDANLAKGHPDPDNS